jgi:hypothetical protein
MPIVSKLISGTSMTMRVMLKVIQFVKEYRTEIVGLAAAIAAYYAIMKAQDAWNAFTGGIKKAIEGVKAFNKALMANPYAAIIGLVVALGTALYGFVKRQREAAKAADEHRKALERQQEAERKTASAVGEVVSKYQLMKQEWEKLTTAKQKREWLEKNRDAFEQLGLNITNAVEADKAFLETSDKVIAALKARAKAEAMQDLYKEKMKEAYERATDEAQNNWDSSKIEYRSYIGKSESQYSVKGEGSAKGLIEAAGLDEEDYWIGGEVAGSHGVYLHESGVGKMREFYSKMAERDAQILTEKYETEIDKIYGDIYDTALNEAQKAEAATGGLFGSGTKGNKAILPLGEESLSDKELKKQHDEALKEVEDWKKKENAINQIAYLQGEKDHCDYTERSKEIDVEYWQKRMAVEKEGSAEYLDAQAKMLDAKKKQDEFYTKGSIEEEQRGYAELKATIDKNYADGKMSAKTYQLALEAAELDHLKAMVELYDEGSEERLKAQEAYQAKSLQYQRKHAEDAKRIQERLQKDYFSNVGMTTNTESYKEEKLQLEAVRQIMMAQATADQKLQIEEAYQKAKYELAKKYNDEAGMMAVDAAQASVDKVLAYMQTDGFQGFYQSFSTLVSGMGEIFSGLSSLIDSEVTIQEQKINQKYEAEIAAAGNNKKKIAEIEAQKEKEIAELKNDAEKKKYGMQIAQAIAQTAISAINAFSSASAIPLVGWIMGPIAAAMAVAAGAIQIATLKKQRDAALAQGYAAGGYTMPGSKYQPAGVVHAGEWVASQELLANPTAAATIAQLDQAQRTNTIGQLSKPSPSASVSSSERISSPTEAHQPSNGSASVGESIDRLNKTLDGGIYAGVMMTGDTGMVRAQKRFNLLNRNKSAK